MSPLRCAIYARVSSDAQEQGTSLETQEAACLTYAAGRGYDVVGIWRETFSGGALHERPQLREVRDLLAAGRLDVLLSYALDRLSRSQTHLGVLDDECQRAGVQLEFVTERFEDTAVGRFIRGASSFAAELEREKIAERTTRGKLARAAAGKLSPRPRPYGYQWTSPEHDALIADDGEAPIVRSMYALMDGGATLWRLAEALLEDGVPSPRGLPVWGLSRLRAILRNPLYRGEGVYGRIATVRQRGKAVQRERPPAEWLHLPAGVVEPLIDGTQWERVQQRLTGNQQRASRRARHPERFLLRGGFARCAGCGTVLHVTHQGATVGAGGGYTYYRCGVGHSPRARLQASPCPAPASYPTAALDRLVWRTVLAHRPRRLPEPEARSDGAQRARRLDELGKALRDLGRRERNRAVALEMADTDEERAPLLDRGKALAAERRRLEAERDALAAEVGETQGWVREMAEHLSRLWQARVRLATLRTPGDYQEMRGWLDRLGVSVEVWRRGVAGAPVGRVRVTVAGRVVEPPG